MFMIIYFLTNLMQTQVDSFILTQVIKKCCLILNDRMLHSCK